jgi:hypothetical protein
MLKVHNQQLKRELEAQKRQLLFAYQVNNEKCMVFVSISIRLFICNKF